MSNKIPDHFEILKHLDTIFPEETVETKSPIVEGTTVGAIGVNMAPKAKAKLEEEEEVSENIDEGFEIDFNEFIEILESLDNDEDIEALIESLDDDSFDVLAEHYEGLEGEMIEEGEEEDYLSAADSIAEELETNEE